MPKKSNKSKREYRKRWNAKHPEGRKVGGKIMGEEKEEIKLNKNI